jgi:hypothetical protein
MPVTRKAVLKPRSYSRNFRAQMSVRLPAPHCACRRITVVRFPNYTLHSRFLYDRNLICIPKR